MKDEGNYNREDTWDEFYREHVEEKTGVSDFRSFAEQFADRGMKGFNKGEKEAGEFRGKGQPGFAAAGGGGRVQRYPDEPQAKLDMHGLTLGQAEPMLERFIRESREMGLILVIVIPGIGRNSEDGKAKLRPMAVRKLEEMVGDHLVANFKSAEARHGGFGALYVYLK